MRYRIETEIRETISEHLKKYYNFQLIHYDIIDEIKLFSTSLMKTSHDKLYAKADSNFLRCILKRDEQEYFCKC